jgi:hypothetical protein
MVSWMSRSFLNLLPFFQAVPISEPLADEISASIPRKEVRQWSLVHTHSSC